MMTQKDAWKLIQYYYDNGRRKEDRRSFKQICQDLIDEYGDMNAADALADEYLFEKDNQNALKYYRTAAGHDDPYALCGLRDLLRSGTIEPEDDQQDYACYQKAIELLTGRKDTLSHLDLNITFANADACDNVIYAILQTADMIQKGQAAPSSDNEYERLVTYLDAFTKRDSVSDTYRPEIEYRFAGILLSENPPEKKRALENLLDARNRMKQRLKGDSFYGDYDFMKEIVLRIYELMPFDEKKMDLYDLFFAARKPCTVIFFSPNQKYEAAIRKDGTIQMGAESYESLEDWFLNGRIDGYAVSFMNEDCHDFQMKKEIDG